MPAAMWKTSEETGRRHTCTLQELREIQVNMFTTVFIGNSQSVIMGDKLVTKRGYQIGAGARAREGRG